MTEILNYLPLLAIAMICNLLCGLYYNIRLEKMKFNYIKLLDGIIKALIIGVVFMGLSFIFDSIPNLATTIGISPSTIILSGIILYATKSLKSLAKILGIKINK